MKYRSRLFSAAVLAVASLLLPLGGCDTETGDSGGQVNFGTITTWVNLQGIVRDYVTNAPISGATVRLYCGQQMNATTDSNGYWVIHNVPYQINNTYQIRFSATNYGAFTADYDISDEYVQNINAALSRLLDVTGQVYAGGQPASGASVVLTFRRDNSNYVIDDANNPVVDTAYIIATVGTDGSFTLQDVPADAQGQLFVLAYDMDGDGVQEYNTYNYGNFTASIYQGTTTNIVINMSLGTGNLTVAWSSVQGSGIIEPDADVQVVFSKPVIAANLKFEIYYVSYDALVNQRTPNGDTDPSDEGTIVALQPVAFDSTGTIATVTPLLDFDPLSYDPIGAGTFWIVVSEVSGMAGAVDGTNMASAWPWEFRSTTSNPVPPAAPTGLAFDTDGWDYVTDYDGFYVFDDLNTNNLFDPQTEGEYVYNYGIGRADNLLIPLRWNAVAGAQKYKIYARQTGGINPATTWRLITNVNNFVVVNGFVEATADLSVYDGSDLIFSEYDVYPVGWYLPNYGVDIAGNNAFAEGRTMEFAVVSVNIYGVESTLSSVFSMDDTQPPMLLEGDWIGNEPYFNDLDYDGSDDVDYEFWGGDDGDEISLVFHEPVRATSSGAATVTSSNANAPVQWTRLTNEGGVSYSIEAKLTSSVTTLRADYNPTNPNQLFVTSASNFWPYQYFEVQNTLGNVVCEGLIDYVDAQGATANDIFLYVTVFSGSLNLCQNGFSVRGYAYVRTDSVEDSDSDAWYLDAGNSSRIILDSYIDVAIGDTLRFKYYNGATIIDAERTVTALDVNGFFEQVIVISSALTSFTSGAGNCIEFVRVGDRFTVTNVEDTSGNAIMSAGATVRVDEFSNPVVFGN